ncbi:S-adenosylmethionine:tRNA ribosyltransferase-isomerase [Peptoanaerobacter stomatis]|uniref:S-adenosylmethionine:tRNA ribosyltransferase-isomerase n=1 Tax=Peptoanaerobacter stomatis TaxID=796937 RepID=J5UFA7_9FIRM|nr:tRNA preQ1(34) S-adenosylmethionine ribosyltransferase-isomerase QueA [Peptoanaerobacter stomatis]EJU22094.1 S-adenosylmethionine:tRNA ribosyltransferase-isomerase [Peptoanaerobacter stomatis]NWO24964.1 tRNA preQ1(34) S-adenosylmethionine ribosyltransferase-isomerase QueA [Peptostreptococcaceae bacterium oral taxon 081]
MKTNDFYYDLPEELIAQVPLEDRSASRLMVLDRNTGNVQHKIFKNIIDYVGKDDVLVFNNTRVLPARLFGKKKDTNANIEILLLKRIELNKWQILVKPAKRVKIGTQIYFGNGEMIADVLQEYDEGIRIVEFSYNGVFEDIISKYGFMPLPPYIKEKLSDKERYQTVYSKINGSSAAPTAGLHFTKDLIESLKNKGVQVEYITLHVGLGTFRPVKSDNLEEHQMHSEYYNIAEETKNRLNDAKKSGKRIIAVGTTTVRTLESSANDYGYIQKTQDDTNIFIYPPYDFKFVDCVITNFHLPKSTLIMMISAFAGKDNVFRAYEEAVKEKYRFFSFGDAMFIQ